MFFKNMTLKSFLTSLGVLLVPIVILWIVPLEAGTASGDFLRGFRAGLSAVAVGLVLGVGIYRLVKGKWPNARADERDRLIASKAGEATFYIVWIAAAACAVIVPAAFPDLEVSASDLAVVVLLGISLIYFACRAVAESRN